MKVAHVIYSFNIGGAEILLREAFESKIIQEETDSWLLILHKKHQNLLPELKTSNVKVFDLFSIRLITEYFRLLHFLNSNKFQVVHTHLAIAGIIILSMKIWGLRAKVVYTEHSFVTSYRKLVFFLLGLCYKFFDTVVFISHEVQKNVNDSRRIYWFYSNKNGIVIYNGVNVKKFVPKVVSSSREKLIIGTIASMRKEKRLDRWIEIARAIDNKYPNRFHFIMGGDGSEKPYVEELVDKYNLGKIISLPGIVFNTNEVFPKFDIFLMTSDFEGLGVALLEAMACGCVPVASNVGGIKNLAFENFGLKYNIGSNQVIIEFIGQLLDDHHKLTRYKKEASEFVSKNYSLDKQICSLLQTYQKVIQKC